jgi:hypothetical protein
LKALVRTLLAIVVAVPLQAQERAAEQVRAEVVHPGRVPETGELPVLTSGHFYRAGFLALDGEVHPLGRIAERLSPGVTAGDLPPQVQLYDRIYVRLTAAQRIGAGDRLHVHRPGRTIPPYGRIYEPTGIATVEAVEGDVATAVVVQIYELMTVGDLAFPLPAFPVPAGVTPRPVERGEDLEGAILAFQIPGTLPMIEDIAILNLGARSGVREGDEFVAYLPGRRREWGQRPEVDIARFQVVRAGERTSAARVLAIAFPALEPGLAVRRVARMP